MGQWSVAIRHFEAALMSVIALVDGFVSGEIDGFPVSRSHAL